MSTPTLPPTVAANVPTELLINGVWRPAASGRRFEVADPATTQVLFEVADAGPEDALAALTAADSAREEWRAVSPRARAELLRAVFEEMRAHAEDLAALVTAEGGKPLAESRAEVAYAADYVRWYSEQAVRLDGLARRAPGGGAHQLVLRRPVGPALLITPWNFPIAIPAWKAAPALAFGNTVVLKPANITSAVAAALTQVLHDAGVPPGVFNLVLGRGRVGQAIVDHRDVAAVSFTGSQGVGASVARSAVARQARVQLEMGGKNPLVVLADADLDKAVAIAADGGFFQTGQRCTASSRVIVEDAIHDKFVAALAEKAKGLKVGPALAEGTQVGPASSEIQFEQNMSYVGIATGEGGRLAAGGDKLTLETPGYFMQPTLIADTDPDMRINCEEVFGPVVSTVRAKNYEEALELANRGEFGLSAGIVTTSLKYATHFKRNSESGMVMVNVPTAGVDFHVPFGGRKASSYGPKEQGTYAKDFFTQLKIAYTAAG